MTDKYQTILQINNAVIYHLTRHGLFNEITRVLEEVFHFDRMSILTHHPGEDEWNYFSPAKGVPIPGLPTDTLPVTKGMIPYEAMTEMKTVIADLHDEPNRPGSRYLLGAGLSSMLCVPLIIRDKVLGSVQLSYKKAFPLAMDRVDLFEQVAQQLALAVDNMLAYEQLESSKEKLVEEKTYLKKAIETLGEDHDIIYGSPAMGTLIEDIKNVSATDATVLLTGETGTGKSLVARTIHKLSTRKKDTFFALNCAAMVTTLIESELFGHEKGAFTGANDRKIGRFELADKSTLFLDEISELPLNTQAKLLHVLQEKTFERVGGSQTITTDARIIAATNQDLKQLISEKKFREDLFYRLNIYPMHVPALRERIDDIPLLMSFFVEISCERLRRKAPDFDKSAVDALLEYPWPGNIRELENFIERIVIMKSARRVTGSDIRSILHVSGEDDNRLLTLDEAEKLHIESVLLRTRGVVGGKNGAAELLGIKRPKLQYRMKRLGIEPAEFKYMAN